MIVHARRDGKRNRDPSTTFCGLKSWPDATAVLPTAKDAVSINCPECRGEMKLVEQVATAGFIPPPEWQDAP